jgi:hypothetical protein
MVTLAIAFTVAALAGSFFGALTPVVGVGILLVGTLTGALWLIGVVVRQVARPVGPAQRPTQRVG